jgi:hypothetical protein
VLCFVDHCKVRKILLEKQGVTVFEELGKEAGYDTESLGSVVATRNGSRILSEEVSGRDRESLGCFGSIGDDSYRLRRKGGVEHRVASLGSSTSRNDIAVLGGGGCGAC